MSRRKLENKNIRNIQKSKGSYYITLPISLIRELKWQERQKVVVEFAGKESLIIKDWKKD